MKRKEKLAEYRGATAEAVADGLEGTGKEPVPPAVPVRDRPAGNAQRDPQGEAGTSLGS